MAKSEFLSAYSPRSKRTTGTREPPAFAPSFNARALLALKAQRLDYMRNSKIQICE